MSLIVHESIKHTLDSLHDNLPSATLLHGEAGVGLLTIAKQLAAAKETTVIFPELIRKTSTVPQISIERIRDLYELVRSVAKRQRVVIIDDADMMGHGAQNAFLKLLEEPNQSTHFILTTHQIGSLLPTVRSRTQIVAVPRVSKQQCQSLLPLSNQTKTSQIMFIASGLPAEITRLLSDENYFATTVKSVQLAKKLIEGSSYSRLVTLMSASAIVRHDSIQLIDRCIQLLMHSAKPEGMKRISKLLEARKSIERGGNIKLQLAAAVV